MCHHIQTKSAAPSTEAGYSSRTKLACTWLVYCSEPSCPKALHDFAVCLDEALKLRLPDGCCTGIIKEREADIRQEVYMLLVARYFSGNPELLAATAAADIAEIGNQLCKSINGAIRAVSRCLRKSLIREQESIRYVADPDAILVPRNVHPANRKTLWELPFEQQMMLVFVALEGAVTKKLFSTRGASMAREMLERGMSQSALARSRGISRQSVHETIAPVRGILSALIEEKEFPLT